MERKRVSLLLHVSCIKNKNVFQLLYCGFIFVMLLLTLYQSISVSNVTAKTKPWTSDADKSIYENEDEIKLVNVSKESELEKIMDSTIGKMLAKFFNSLGDGIQFFSDKLGVTLKNIVYGRVDGAGVKVTYNGETYRTSLFTYELSPDTMNIYGSISYAIYSAFRNIAFIGVVFFIGGKLGVAMWKTNSYQVKKTAGAVLGNTFLFFLVLMLLPCLMDLLLYIRDVMLYSVSHLASSLLGLDNSIDICSAFDKIAKKNSGDVLMSIIRLASKFLTWYFAFAYIGIALCISVDVIAFPFVALSMLLTPGILAQWFKNVIAGMLTPIIDAALLLFVLAFSVFGSTIQIRIIQLIVLWMLLPARSEFRRVLGMQPNFGMEMAAGGGFMATLGLAGAAIRGTAGFITGMKGAHDDRKMGDMYADAAQREEQSTQGSSGEDSGTRPSGSTSVSGGNVPPEYETTSSDSAMHGDTAGMSTQFADAEERTTPEMESVGSGSTIESEEMENSAMNDVPLYNSSSALSSGGGRVPEDIAERYAHTNNYLTPEFARLTNAQRAEMYHKKAAQKMLQSFAGLAGGVAGAGIGTAAAFSTSNLMGGGANFGARISGAGAKMASDAVGGINIGLRRQNGMTQQMGAGMSGNVIQNSTGLIQTPPAETGSVDYDDVVPYTHYEQNAQQAAFDYGRLNQDVIISATEEMSYFPRNNEINTAFADCANEYGQMIGTPKSDEDASSVWQDTPQDRYEYFRTQKAEPIMREQFSQLLQSDAVQPLESSVATETARGCFNAEYGRMISDENFTPLKKENLEYMGYNFENGFDYIMMGYDRKTS